MNWTVEGRGDTFAIVDDQGVEVATVPYTNETGAEPLDTAEGRRAVLLSAAPDLLAALEAFIEDVRVAYIGEQTPDMLHYSALAHQWPDLCSTFDAARTAIRNAKGGQ